MTFTLAASAETLFLDLPFLERVRRIAERGLDVEIWNWANHRDDLASLAAMDVRVVSMTGYLRGNLTEDEGIAEFLATAEESLRVADQLGCPHLNIHGTGLDGQGLPVDPVTRTTGRMWARATTTLQRLAALGEREGRVFTLENLNTAVDHPGTPFATAEDTLALVSAVDSPGLRMNLDLYHAQIGEGNLIELCRRSLPWVGEIQVADVPGRCEPGTGEINYRCVAAALRSMGYRGTVALEAFAKGDSDVALRAFIDAFA